ncbi:MAG: hypothetical protein J5845_06405 [Lachnospiraceae bacterium]|nr:hypothetical protein [Lachnospiraceae bacterium]
MKRGYKIAVLILASVLLCCGCTTHEKPGRPVPLTPIPTKGQSTVEPTKEPYVPDLTETEYLMTKDNVKTIGRTYYEKDIRWCGYSGSGVEFTFAGHDCTVHLVSDDQYTSATHAARVGIFVDGERVADVLMDEPRKDVKIIESEKLTFATVKIIKLSEVSDSVVGIESLTMTGSLLPISARATRIEFIGDSITCGYGVDGEFEKDVYSTANEDCTKAFAYKTADLLNADYSLVSISGYGIVSGYTATGEKLGDKILPPYYTKFGMSIATFGEGRRADEIDWDFDEFLPDIVVINLGTNDSSYCKDDAKKREYIDGYKEFLAAVRAKNPDAKIICTLGIMGTELCESMEKAVEEFKTEKGDTNIVTMRFEEQDVENDGIVVDWHPSEATHGKAAKKLAKFITELQQEEW